MKKFLIIISILAIACCCFSCGIDENTPRVTEINFLDENSEPLKPDENGAYVFYKATAEVYFSGDVDRIDFYKVVEDKHGKLDGDYISGADVHTEKRALFDWTVPYDFDGYIWVVLNENTDLFDDSVSRHVISSGEEEGVHAVFTCEYKGEPFQIMLYKPVDQSRTGIWAVQSYKDADGVHPWVYEPIPRVEDATEYFQIKQASSDAMGGDPVQLDPEQVALKYLKEEFDFEPEKQEVVYQSDNRYR